MQDNYLKELKMLCWENSFTPEPTRAERLAYFAHLVAEQNTKINLISRRDIDSIIEKHVFLSAYVTKFIPEKVINFLDIGTGGGFPGIPFAIMRPELEGVLVDSTNKKILAVQQFIDQLKLSNAVAESTRVEGEEFISKYADSFDMIISRSTVPLIILLRYALPLIKDKAYLLAMKGGDLNDEFKKAETKYKAYIRKSTVYELAYKPTNVRNKKGKKLVLLELQK